MADAVPQQQDLAPRSNGEAVVGAQDAVRRLAGATGSCSMTMQHVDGRELWTVHAHVNGASIQGQGGDLPTALAKLHTVRQPIAA